MHSNIILFEFAIWDSVRPCWVQTSQTIIIVNRCLLFAWWHNAPLCRDREQLFKLSWWTLRNSREIMVRSQVHEIIRLNSNQFFRFAILSQYWIDKSEQNWNLMRPQRTLRNTLSTQHGINRVAPKLNVRNISDECDKSRDNFNSEVCAKERRH